MESTKLVEITPYENCYSQGISEFMEQYKALKAAYHSIVEPKGLYERTKEDGVIQHDYERKKVFVDLLAKSHVYNILRLDIGEEDGKFKFCHVIKPREMPEIMAKTTNNGSLEFVKEIQEIAGIIPPEAIDNMLRVMATELGVFQAAYEKGEGEMLEIGRFERDLPEKYTYDYELAVGEISGTINFFDANVKRVDGISLYHDDFMEKITDMPKPELNCIAEVNEEFVYPYVDKKTEELMAIYEKEEIQKNEKENEPVEIVESNDGYVMNMTERTSANAYKIDNQVKETAGSKEVVHNEAPKETTTDIAKVGGNTKLEAVSKEGTKDVVEKDIREDKENHEEAKKEEAKEEKKKKNFFKKLFERD